MKLVMDKETLITLEEYRAAHNLPKIENYGMSVEHNPKSKEIYDFISEVDFVNGDAFCFKCGGDGDDSDGKHCICDIDWIGRYDTLDELEDYLDLLGG